MIVADNDFKNYQIDVKESKAFLFSPGGRWCQSFLIVWTPGYLSVIGDMGDLIIRVEALEDFITGMKWLYRHANPNSCYFMEKVLNHKIKVFDPEATKERLIETFSDMTAEDIQKYAENHVSYELLDRIFDNNLDRFLNNLETEQPITGDDIIEKLKNYVLDESDAEEITDYEDIVYTHDWAFLNCRIEALKEFAKKQLEALGVPLDE